MMQEPTDRHEHVQVTTTAGGIHEQRVVHDTVAEEHMILQRVTQFIWLIAAMIELLILTRIFLKLIAANPLSPFAAFVYGLSDLFLFPFFGLTATPAVEGSVLEISSLIAMFVYFFAFWVLTKLVWLLLERPLARSTTTYDAVQTPQPAVVVREQPVVEERIVHEQPVVEKHIIREQPVIEEHIVEEHIVEKPVVKKTVIHRGTHINDPLE